MVFAWKVEALVTVEQRGMKYFLRIAEKQLQHVTQDCQIVILVVASPTEISRQHVPRRRESA